MREATRRVLISRMLGARERLVICLGILLLPDDAILDRSFPKSYI
jgi:hypothetical protein